MGKTGYSRRSTAQPTTHGSTRRPRGDGRLDPVRWRRPGRGTLVRLVAVTALLATAVAVSWSPAQSCDVPAAGRVVSSASPTRPTGASGSGTARAAPDGAAGSGSDQAGAGTGGSDRAGAALGSGSGQAGATPGGSSDQASRATSGSDQASEAAGGSDQVSAGVPAGSVGVPIRLADPTALSLVRPGNRVDLLRIGDSGSHPTAVAAAALVLRVTGTDDPTTGGGLLLALTPQEAQQAVTTNREGFAIVIRPG